MTFQASTGIATKSYVAVLRVYSTESPRTIPVSRMLDRHLENVDRFYVADDDFDIIRYSVAFPSSGVAVDCTDCLRDEMTRRRSQVAVHGDVLLSLYASLIYLL